MKRLNTETYEEYKKRRAIANKIKKHLLHGTTIISKQTFANPGTLEHKRLTLSGNK